MTYGPQTMRGIHQRQSARLAVGRVVIWQGDTTPVDAAFHIRPTAEPTYGTPVKGDMYFDSTVNALMQYTGSAWEQVGATPSADLTVTGDLTVTDDLTMNSTGAILTMGPAATNPITLTQSADTLTLGVGDAFVADDITVNDDLNVGDDINMTSTGAILTMGPAATNPITLTQSANTLTLGTGDTFIADDITINDDLTVGNAWADTLIVNGRIASASRAGALIDIGASDVGEGVELKYKISDWTSIPLRDSNETFVGAYIRAEATADDATAHAIGVEGWGVANAVGIAQIEGVRGWAYSKGDTTDTIAFAYGVRGEFSMDAGRANTLTLTTEAAGVLARITSGKVDDYTKIHGFVARFGDMDGGSQTYGSGLLVLDGVEAGTSALTHGVHISPAATNGLTLTGATTNALNILGAATNLFYVDAVEGFVSGTPGTLTPTHKLAVNIEGVGTRYIHCGTVA